MKKMRGKLLKAAALTAAAFTLSLPLSLQSNVMPITAHALYSPTDTNYTTGQSGGLQYAKYSDHIEILGCDSNTTTIDIPETIDGLPVTAIARYGFECSSLTSVTLPESIKTIGYWAFAMCSDLTTVKLPDSLEVIEMHAFELCPKLDTIEFPDHMVEIHARVFDETPWLEAQRKIDPLVVVNGALIDGRTATGDVVVPSGVKYVSASTFWWNTKVTSVVFPSSVTTLIDNTFFQCEGLTSIELKGVTEIESMAFCGCTKLNDLKLSGKLTKIADDAFADTSSSSTITFYGSRDTWERVEKPNDSAFLQRATMVFDESGGPADEVIGDINANGEFNVSDALLLQKWLLAVPGTELKNWKAGDLCEDNVLDIYDLILIRRQLLK